MSPFDKDTGHFGLLPYDLILTNYFAVTHFQVRSYSEVMGIRTLMQEIGGEGRDSAPNRLHLFLRVHSPVCLPIILIVI